MQFRQEQYAALSWAGRDLAVMPAGLGGEGPKVLAGSELSRARQAGDKGKLFSPHKNSWAWGPGRWCYLPPWRVSSPHRIKP